MPLELPVIRTLFPRKDIATSTTAAPQTWTAGRLIARLFGARKTVGVASTSHRAIHKLLQEVEAGAAELGVAFRGLKKASGGNPESEYEGSQIENVHDNKE